MPDNFNENRRIHALEMLRASPIVEAVTPTQGNQLVGIVIQAGILST
ncbi:hypothetical protein J7355_09120 [Endozoicomonas sp. G2_2]|nr:MULTISPECIES: hypothetical protein [Gammaproteobacteria]MBO9470257.1 hypothetical protein [Endozoicomonas sp. G2_2]